MKKSSPVIASHALIFFASQAEALMTLRRESKKGGSFKVRGIGGTNGWVRYRILYS